MKLYTCISVYMTHMFWFEVNHESRLAMEPRRFASPIEQLSTEGYMFVSTRYYTPGVSCMCKAKRKKKSTK